MAELSLEDLMKAKGAAGDTAPAPVDEAKKVAEVVEELSPEERAKVDKLKNEIDPMNSQALITYGTPAQKRIAAFSESVLSEVRAKDAGEVGQLLGGLVTQVKSFNPEGAERGSFLAKIPLVGSLVKKAEDLKQGYEKLSVQVDRIAGALEQARLKMLKDVKRFDKLYAENVAYFKDLELYIRAGEEKIQELREETLPKLEEQAIASNDPMAVQVVADFKQTIERFDQKVHDLKISKTVAIQTAPQIRLIQNNDKILIDRVQSAIYQTIPLWKSQLVIALGLQAQQKVLQLQRQVNDTTNTLLRRNAELLEQNSIETARENQRSIVDIETVREVNDRLVHTIEETVRIGEEGRAKRKAAEQELTQIEGRLKDVLLAHSSRRA